MSRSGEIRDAQVLIALSGFENLSGMPMTIVDDYLLKEKIENLKEQGFPVPDEFLQSDTSELEMQVRKNDAILAEVEGQRVNRMLPEYPGRDKEEAMIDRMIEAGPKKVVKI